ncbi:MAG: oligopeptide transporter, OPT family [Candidatus Marinimicrobia bacterium]|jgi:putative OPT family oligopeptide transporter|nr:oligopeptide transporter, OPT family [Candidatus Neomarinimicrobiota bacterium]MCK9483070.1 oligopeptide transporter, OPT family [Candidatus Neomarinimicrobiota bacterium]MCK9559243.1 oligopeptide transporter, OPT family [Candidatus Neomarinimicrobiota bacterium]MDD5061260.1 oligopeptide transporter, OPT family [Candidatus Neomarinimicrobiota bacterium]MDD5539385.1 oligopeptide transporter, OPT family [Candidatus Neomarinimicrobiota bacterium]
MDSRDQSVNKLPENAYRTLKSDEEYIPVIPDQKIVPEVTSYSLGWGLFYAVLFSMAAAYLGLKIGQVFEAAIPIAILAAGLSVLLKRKNALQENVIIQSIGSSSGVIVAGAIFTIPGLYILGLNANYLQIFLASLLGGFLGILFLIPFRKYFVKDMHGEFPFPEATATTEVLVAGEGGGDQARVLVSAALVGGLYDFCVAGLGFWKEVVSTSVFRWGALLSDKLKWVLKINIGAAVTGLGYIIGLRYSAIIASGSFLAWWVIVPMVGYVAGLGDQTPDAIFFTYVRPIGIGAIAAAGIIGILKSSRIIGGAFKLAGKELFGGAKGVVSEKSDRIQKDIPMKWVAIFLALTLIVIFLFFLFGVQVTLKQALVGLLIVTVISFLFTTVAARAIAIVGSNPVSGMTLMTLLLSSFILVKVGLVGNHGMLAALLIGGVVCTALSMAGGFISDLKTGYWLGTTPIKQEGYKFLGSLFSAASVGLVILLLNKTFGFGGDSPLQAPQASAMAAVIKPLMTGAQAPWILYLTGIFLAIILEIVHVPPLAFALGIYLPIQLNTPLLFGGLVAYFVSKSSKNEKLVKARGERGTLIASGFIAGGAIMGVVSAFIIFIGQKFFGEGWTLAKGIGTMHWAESAGGEILGFVMFALLCVYLYWDSLRVKNNF